jgi:hypothetical protein
VKACAGGTAVAVWIAHRRHRRRQAQFDVGCDNVTDPDWQEAVALHARSALYRDDNGWRLIPVRVTGREKREVRLRMERVVVE